MLKTIISVMMFAGIGMVLAQTADDPFLWLENIDADSAMAWVHAQNQTTCTALQNEAGYTALYEKLLTIYNSKDRIAYPAIQGRFLYNFWQDDKHERGLWRRTTWAEFAKRDPVWETVLDIDSLSAVENEKWVYSGADWLYPDCDRCLLHLSRGGGDAVVVREFDATVKKFVVDGFQIPAAKSQVSWIDRHTLYVGTDFGPGSMTTSGYPRLVKKWQRGTLLAEAETVFQGNENDMTAAVYVLNTPERSYTLCLRQIDFYTSEKWVLEQGRLVKLDLPEDAQISGILGNQLVIELKSDWTVNGTCFKQGSLLSADYDAFIKGDRRLTLIDQPDERSSISGAALTKNMLLVTRLENVKSSLLRYWRQNGVWQSEKMDLPEFGAIAVLSTDDFSDRFFVSYSDFITPITLYGYGFHGRDLEKIKEMPAFFASRKLQIEQQFAVSKDGTRIPYFMVSAKEMKNDGRHPTLLYGYGGFEVSMLPSYSAGLGAAWLEKGGVYVLANIRGGGEFGPQWHQAALKENRQKAYDDFIAVAEHLVRRQVTSPRHLGIRGGSNGGLLMGVMFTQRPDLFHAVVCEVPLLDMQRYHKLLAGASWMAEYGNPDIKEEWSFIKKYSPYQNLSADKKYPCVYFTTTTRDDRVHPGHARKMAAKMASLGHPFYYFENTEGGHSAGSTNAMRALSSALSYTYLWKQLH